jgi:hypothetical protein
MSESFSSSPPAPLGMMAEGCPVSDEYITRIRSVLFAHGITSYRLRIRRHRRVVVATGSREIKVTFPTSGSDWRSARNAAADLHRQREAR